MGMRKHHYSGAEKDIAKKSGAVLRKFRTAKILGHITLNVNNQVVELPSSIVTPLIDLLNEISKDHEPALLISQSDEWLSSQEAADILNVSRPFLVKLIDSKKIPCFKVGRHRRIYKIDLLSYKEKSLDERKSILQKLVDEAQDLDMGY